MVLNACDGTIGGGTIAPRDVVIERIKAALTRAILGGDFPAVQRYAGYIQIAQAVLPS